MGVLLAVLSFQYLTIGLATIGAPIRRQDKMLLASVAPRGIVAAATAGIFGPELVAAGYPGAHKLLPTTFMIIIVTVPAHGLTIGPLARRLDLAARSTNGLLIVGASPWTCALAKALKQLEVEVLLVSGVYHRLKDARMQGIDVYYGEILSEHAEYTLDAQHLQPRAVRDGQRLLQRAHVQGAGAQIRPPSHLPARHRGGIEIGVQAP